MQAEMEKITARGMVYKQLSRGFNYPGDRLGREIHSGAYAADLARASAPLDMAVDRRRLVPAGPVEDLAPDYIHYFEIGQRTPPCPLYGGLYQQETRRSTLLLELSEFYRAFGLAVDTRSNELQDHVSMELEFMYFLCFKEEQALAAGRPELQGYRLAQRDFLDRHLGRWLPQLAARIEEKCGNNFYRALAGLGANFVTGETLALVGGRD